ncbi:AlbA family DNA-binding domain-containing protein [Bradyrhizobium sp. AZCC 1577]|uniref:AlbA family DNA-binding domain-containing protein n=1 Tax=Bradyrhizobium sp. AZCC 1577 TaxID=3117019 RepID=UPI002FF2971C
MEVKEWLDLTDHDHRAVVAKEIIALANHGGGVLVVGFEEKADGTFDVAAGRPANLDAWSQDNIQSIVAKYIDPGVQCRVLHRSRNGGAEKYPVIVVPGGHRVPIRAKAGSPDGKKLIPHRVYIRRPGPAGEEPKSAEEWDRFFERCLQNRRAELLDAMRSIMAGVIPNAGPATPTRLDQLKDFEAKAIARWEALVASLPSGVPPTLPNGHYDLSIAIDGDFDRQSLSNLYDTIRLAVRNHSGWPPFVNLSRAPFRPKPADGAIECWVGPDDDGSFDKPAHHDFWRISPEGLLFTRRGYPEDGGWKGVKPGTSLDITTPTWRLGEAILEAFYIAQALHGTNANLILSAKWTKLAGRVLVSHGNSRRIMFDGYRTGQDHYEATATVGVASLPDALPEVVFSMLAPLYELFDFFKLPKRLVEEELKEMSRNTFAH